jgi:nitrogen fixation protein FixH
MTPLSARPPGEFTGRHMLLVTVAFFAVIIGVNITMAVFATTTWTGLVVQNSYIASQEFNDREAARRAQMAAGWRPSVTYGKGEIILAVTAAGGGSVVLDRVTLDVSRPIGTGDDRHLDLARRPDGTSAAALVLEAGVWNAVLRADTPLGPFELHERLLIEPEAAP